MCGRTDRHGLVRLQMVRSSIQFVAGAAKIPLARLVVAGGAHYVALSNDTSLGDTRIAGNRDEACYVSRIRLGSHLQDDWRDDQT